MKKVLNYAKANPIVIMLVAVSIVVGLTTDNFFSWSNLGNLMSNTTIRFIIALGVSGCLITKGTDLSAGRQVGLAGCIAGILIQRGDYTGRLFPNIPEMNIFVVLVIVVIIGIIIGGINGLIIAILKVPPFIATLGMQTIVYGLALTLTNAQPIGGFQKIYTQLVTGRIGSTDGFYLPYLFFVALFFGLLFWFIYNKTRHGKYMYAIGGNEVAAEVSGVNTKKTTISIYVIAGVMYAIAGWLLAAKSGGASSGLALIVTNAQPIGGFQKIYTQLVTGRIGSTDGFYLPYLFFVALGFGLLFWFIYNKTIHGKYMYAIGGNEVAAEVSGVNTKRTTISIYLIAGVMYAIAGWLLAAKAGGASSGLAQGYELEAIAGCTIGGVSTTGGIGTVPGIVIGVLVFELLKIVLQFLGVNPYYNYIVQGLVIVVAVALDIRKNTRKK